LGVLVAAIAACALIVGASALSLPITANGSGNSPITFEPLIPSEEQDGADYLVPGVVDVEGVPTDMLTYADDWDSTYSVMRTVNLKVDTFDTPGVVNAKVYTKWSYTTHVKLQDVSMLPMVGTEIAAVHLSTLTIYGVNEATLYPVQWSITLGGVAMGLDLASYAVAVQDLDLGTMTIDITLPQYAYENGAEIVILVQYRAAMTWDSSEGFSEVGFPEFPIYVAPESV
jgi:hypothetical protein